MCILGAKTKNKDRLFEIPAHPCLRKRREDATAVAVAEPEPEEGAGAGAKAGAETETSPKVTLTAKTLTSRNILHVTNFVLDHTTILLMLEALRRSGGEVDTLNLHNTGLTPTSIQSLVEGLPQTAIHCLTLDYNRTKEGEVLKFAVLASEVYFSVKCSNFLGLPHTHDYVGIPRNALYRVQLITNRV